MRNVQYEIIQGTMQSVQEEVTKRLNEDWGLIGGPFVVGRDTHQAVIKETSVPVVEGKLPLATLEPGPDGHHVIKLVEPEDTVGNSTQPLEHIG
jgi:hypothetical protein